MLISDGPGGTKVVTLKSNEPISFTILVSPDPVLGDNVIQVYDGLSTDEPRYDSSKMLLSVCQRTLLNDPEYGFTDVNGCKVIDIAAKRRVS